METKTQLSKDDINEWENLEFIFGGTLPLQLLFWPLLEESGGDYLLLQFSDTVSFHLLLIKYQELFYATIRLKLKNKLSKTRLGRRLSPMELRN